MDTDRDVTCDDWGRGTQLQASTLRIAGTSPEARKRQGRKDSPFQVLEEPSLCWHLSFGLLAPRTLRQSISAVWSPPPAPHLPMLQPQQTHREPACRYVLIQVPASALFHLNFLTFKLLHHLGNSVSFCKPLFNRALQQHPFLTFPGRAKPYLCTAPKAACLHRTRCDTQHLPRYLHVCVPVTRVPFDCLPLCTSGCSTAPGK